MTDCRPTVARRGTAAGWLALVLLLLATAGGCASRPRLVVITAEPPDASISIDGTERAKGLFRDELSFDGGRTYTVRVARLGYTDETRVLDGSPEQDRISVALKPRLKQIKVVVKPRLPASIRVDGRPVGGPDRVEWSDALEFTVDAQNQWIPRRITAYRAGFREAAATVRFTDPRSEYELNLLTETKSVMIRTDPPGADVFVNGRRVGVSPALAPDLALEVDPVTNEYRPYQVRATKAGFEDAFGTISWDTPAEMTLRLAPAAVAIRPPGPTDVPPPPATRAAPVPPLTTAPIVSTPVRPPAPPPSPAATQVAIRPAPPATVPTVTPTPPPQTKPVVAPTPPPVSPVPAPAPAAVTATVTLLRPKLVWRPGGGWGIDVDQRELAAPKSPDEPDGRSVRRVVGVEPDECPDGLVSSPDGSLLAYAVLTTSPTGARARVMVKPTDPAKPAAPLLDGRMDLMPSFAPGGGRILFVADRGDADRLVVRQMHVGKRAPPEAVGPKDPDARSADVWPSLDSSPRPRLFVEAHAAGDGGRRYRLFAVDPTTGTRTDLGQVGAQPRVSPRADAIAFARADPLTGKRDLYLLRDPTDPAGGTLANLTNSPDDDDYDPAWSKDGSRLAWTSDRVVRPPAAGGAAGTGRDANVWVTDLAAPESAAPVTASPAADDQPAWSGDDDAIYFRSNRGGEWAIWRVAVPIR